MFIHYLFLFFLSLQSLTFTSDLENTRRSQLQRKKKQLEEKIQYLQDKMLYQEANSEEPAELYGYLRELKQVNAKMKALARQ